MRRPPSVSRLRPSLGRLGRLFLIACGPLLVGCDKAPDDQALQALFDEGEYRCLEKQWVEAHAVLKAYLIYRPDHPGAHFYLGRSYLVSHPAIAEGEIQTALELFIEGGRSSSIERFGHEYFELICGIDSAKACLLQIDYMWAWGAPPALALPLLERAERYVREADLVIPDTQEVGSLERRIAPYRSLRNNTYRQRLRRPSVRTNG